MTKTLLNICVQICVYSKKGNTGNKKYSYIDYENATSFYFILITACVVFINSSSSSLVKNID